jgi:ParB/RepB/Spo0J family partition protein
METAEKKPKKRKFDIDAQRTASSGIPLEEIDAGLRADDEKNAQETEATKRVERTDGFAAEVAQAMAPAENPHALEPLPKPASKIAYLPLKALKESPTNPRKTYARMEELTASVKSAGLLVPLIVRELRRKGAEDATEYEIVAGHRRYRAAKGAGLKEVPCDVRTLTDAQVTEIQITENLQRADLTDLEEAETYESLRDKHGYSVDQIAAKIGVSKGTIYSRLKLMALCPEARQALADGVLPASVAVPLARLPTHKLQASALKTLKDRFSYEDGMGARPAIEYLQREFCRSLKGAPFSLTDAALVPEAGPCSACPKNTATGTPGLFEDLKSAGKTCTDVACFERKAKAAWERTAEKEAAKGAEVLTPDEGSKLYQYGSQISYGSKYVELDEKNHADPKKRTWGELLESLPEAKRPKRVVVPDRDLVAHEVVDRGAIVEALAERGLKWAEEETGRKSKTAAVAKEERAARKDEDLRRRVLGLAIEKLSAKGPGRDSLEAFWKLLGRGVAAKWTTADVAEALGFESGSKDWLEHRDRIENGKASASDALAFLTTALVFELGETTDALYEGEYPGAVDRLMKANGIALKEIEKAQRAAAEAEALMEKKPKAKKEEAA